MKGRPVALAVALLAVAVLIPADANASTGNIAVASASSDWSSASIAGAVYRTTECVEPPDYQSPPRPPGWPEPEPSLPPPPEYFSLCAWIPYATVGPGDDCASPERRWPAKGSKVQVVWSGGERTGVGSAAFDLPDVALELGMDASLLCLSVVEAAAEGIACVQIIPSPCPPYVIVGRSYQLDSALLEAASAVASPPSIPPAEEALEVQATAAGVARPTKRRCRKNRHGTRRKAAVKLKAGRKSRCGARRHSR